MSPIIVVIIGIQLLLLRLRVSLYTSGVTSDHSLPRSSLGSEVSTEGGRTRRQRYHDPFFVAVTRLTSGLSKGVSKLLVSEPPGMRSPDPYSSKPRTDRRSTFPTLLQLCHCVSTIVIVSLLCLRLFRNLRVTRLIWETYLNKIDQSVIG